MATINGAIITDFGSYEHGDWVFTQADGKIVVLGITAGLSGDDMAIARYNSNGSLDSTFDGDGKLITTSVMNINAVRLLSDGKFLAVGSSSDDFAVARYNSNGSLDTSFSGDGKLTTNASASSIPKSYAFGVTTQGDGKILVVGKDARYPAFVAVRYNSDGSLDMSFSEDGTLVRDNMMYGAVASAAIQPDGKIVLAGDYYQYNIDDYRFGIMRLNRDGTRDTSFNGGGSLTTDLGGDDYIYTVRDDAFFKIPFLARW